MVAAIKEKRINLHKALSFLMAVVMVISALMVVTLAWTSSQHRLNVLAGGDIDRTITLQKVEVDANGEVVVNATNVPALVAATDLVFALSNAEVWEHFGPGQMGQQPDMLWNANMVTNGMALTTAYAQSKGAYTHLGAAPWRTGNGGWWTRSAGRTSTVASNVTTYGSTSADHSVAHAIRGPRPALWVDLDA